MAKCISESYGHAYLTSYGWTGSGTGLRQGAIDKPLAIPPKKNLNGLGKDRDDAFPFWDHLFTAASKAIKIKVSSDDEVADDTESLPPSPFVLLTLPKDPSHTNPDSVQFRRTTTGILSNQRPIYGTSASTSGTTTPNPSIGAGIPAPNQSLSLLATAKREAVKHGLYSRFFRGPVLGPDGDPPLTPASSESPSVSAAVPAQVGDRDGALGGLKKDKKRRSENKAETKEERKERKILKKERRAARAAKKEGETLAKRKKDRLDDIDRRARQHRDKVTWSEERGGKQARKFVADLEGDDLQQARCTQKRLGEEFTPSNNGQQDTSRGPPGSVGATDVVRTTKKRKRKDTLP